MFRKKNILTKIVEKGFFIEDEAIIFQQNNTLNKLSIQDSELVLSFELPQKKRIQKIEKFDKGYFGLKTGQLLFLNPKLELIEEIDLDYVEDFYIFKNRYIISVGGSNKDGLDKTGLYNLNTCSNIWETDFEKGWLGFVNEKYILSLSPTEIKSRLFETGDIIWERSIINGTMRPMVIGSTDEIVFIGLEAAKRFLALDLKTGIIIWEMEALTQFVMHNENKSNIQALTGSFLNFDANTGKVLDRFLDYSYFEQVGIFTQRNNCAFVGDHIITTDSSKGIIGAFNTITHKFDWVHHEPGVNFPGAHPIRYSEPYLFLHDNHLNLHVFERD